jgi:hypothetical protein
MNKLVWLPLSLASMIFLANTCTVNDLPCLDFRLCTGWTALESETGGVVYEHGVSLVEPAGNIDSMLTVTRAWNWNHQEVFEQATCFREETEFCITTDVASCEVSGSPGSCSGAKQQNFGVTVHAFQNSTFTKVFYTATQCWPEGRRLPGGGTCLGPYLTPFRAKAACYNDAHAGNCF